MGRLNQNKQGIIWLILVFMPLIVFLVYQISKRNQDLKEFDFVCGEVYKVSLNQRKGVTSNKNVARYYYNFDGIEYDKSSEFYTFDVKVGDVFKVKVSKQNPETHEIVFDKKYINCEQIKEE